MSRKPRRELIARQPQGVFPEKNANRKPLRSSKELSDEFGITPFQFGAYMRRDDAPKAVLISRTGGCTYYGAAEARAYLKRCLE